MENKLIIVSHIGTSSPEAINRELDPLVELVGRQFEAHVVLAFSQTKTIAINEQTSRTILSLEQVLKTGLKNYQEVNILVTHLTGGGDYQKIQDLVAGYARFYPLGIKVTRPLLATAKNRQQLSKIIGTQIYSSQKIILVGHGSRHQSHEYYQSFLADFSLLAPQAQMVFLHDFKEVLNDVFNQPVQLFPLFVIGGYHLHHDVLGLENSLKQYLLAQNCQVVVYPQALLSLKAVRDLYLANLENI